MALLNKATTISTLALLMCTPLAFSASIYRCGSTYQDTPCATANAQSIKSPSASASAKAEGGDLSPYKVDADCKERGNAAKKIMWQRQVGKTEQEQLETAQDTSLVKEVYNLRGTPVEVKNAVESECMKQKERNDLADQLLLEAKRLKNGNNPSATAANNKAPQPTADAQKVNAIDESSASKKAKAQCETLREMVTDLANQRRKGGSSTHMDDLKIDQQKLEKQIKAAGC